MLEELNWELLKKEAENEKILEEIKKIEEKSKCEYFDEEWDLLVWFENNIEASEEELEDEDDEEESSEYILVSIQKNAEKLLWKDRFAHLEDDFSDIEWIEEIFMEDDDKFLIDRETCSISERVIKIEILNIYLKLLVESIKEEK